VANLRKRLDQYFETEGRRHPVRLVIPRGHYRLDAVVQSSQGSRRPLWVARGFIAVLGLGLLGWALVAWLGLRASNPRAAGYVDEANNPVLQAVFRKDADTCIILADSVWALVQDLLNVNWGLKEYDQFRSGSLPQVASKVPFGTQLNYIAGRTYTSFADAKAAALLLDDHPPARSIRLRLARGVSLRDLRDDAVILLGSVRSTPWVELFRDRLTFWVEYDVESRLPRVVNRHPRPGEFPRYVPGASPDGQSIAHGVIALFRNLSGAERVLLIAGTTSQATEAGVELVTNPDQVNSFLKRAGAGPGELPDFELLYAAGVSRGLPQRAEVIAWRIYQGEERPGLTQSARRDDARLPLR